MPKGEQSKLKLYSLGIVLVDKADNSDMIQVHPIEELPQVEGKIIDIKVEYDVTLPDAQDEQKTAKIKGDMSVNAKWFPGDDGNRMTAPDVIKNETVRLYKYGDDDQFYWTTLFREPTIRRKERVCYMYCDLASGMAQYDKESSYWYEFSTKDGHIWISTSQASNEAFKYDFIIDTVNSTVGLFDDVNNGFFIDSPGELSMMRNQNGCSVTCEKMDVKTVAIETSSEKAKDITQEASNSASRKAQTISDKAANSATREATTITDKATSITQQATSITQKTASLSIEATSMTSKATGGGGMDFQTSKFRVANKDWMKRLDQMEARLRALDGQPNYTE